MSLWFLKTDKAGRRSVLLVSNVIPFLLLLPPLLLALWAALTHPRPMSGSDRGGMPGWSSVRTTAIRHSARSQRA